MLASRRHANALTARAGEYIKRESAREKTERRQARLARLAQQNACEAPGRGSIGTFASKDYLPARRGQEVPRAVTANSLHWSIQERRAPTEVRAESAVRAERQVFARPVITKGALPPVGRLMQSASAPALRRQLQFAGPRPRSGVAYPSAGLDPSSSFAAPQRREFPSM